jgi:hypothetical protein
LLEAIPKYLLEFDEELAVLGCIVYINMLANGLILVALTFVNPNTLSR